MKDVLKEVANRIGMYDWGRKVYYRTIRSRTDLELLGIRKRFWTGTVQLYDRVRNAGGEREQLEGFIRSIRIGDVVWDVGSFVGMYAMFACEATGPSDRVFAFEPEPNAYRVLQLNRRMNNAENVVVLNFGLSDRTEEGFIYCAKQWENAIHSLEPGAGLEKAGRRIQLYKGDKLIDEQKALAPNVVKIDVEGAEGDVLNGMMNLLSRRECRWLLIEVHPKKLRKFGKSMTEIKSMIVGLGFSISRELERGSEVHWFCTK